MSVVLDVSVAAKWLFLEQGTDESMKLLERFDSFFAPDLFAIELDAIIAKKVRKREITVEEAVLKKEQSLKLPVNLIEYDRLRDIAFEISTSLPVTLYDAAYLSTAIYRSTVCYTADERLVNGISTTPLKGFVTSIFR